MAFALVQPADVFFPGGGVTLCGTSDPLGTTHSKFKGIWTLSPPAPQFAPACSRKTENMKCCCRIPSQAEGTQDHETGETFHFLLMLESCDRRIKLYKFIGQQVLAVRPSVYHGKHRDLVNKAHLPVRHWNPGTIPPSGTVVITGFFQMSAGCPF